MILKRLKIRTRIYAGFGSLVVLGLVVATVGSWGIDGLGRELVKMDSLIGNIRYVSSAMEGEELVARLLLRMSNDPDSSLKARFQEAQVKVRDAISEAKSHSLSAVRREIDQNVLDALGPQAESAEKSFGLGLKMVEGRKRLFSGGDALTAATSRLVDAVAKSQSAGAIASAGALERAVLLVRVANWRFLATHDAGGPDVFRKNTANAVAAITAFEKLDVPDMSPFVQPVREALLAYRDAFDATAPALTGMAEAYETVQRPMANAIQADLAKIDASLAHDIAEATVRSTSLRDTTSETQIIVAGIGLVGGIVLAFFIGRGIARPISGMTTTMAKLAAGNHDVEIPGADSHDEIGDMARAVKVFKDNMLDAERLAAEQEAGRAARARRQDAMDRHTQSFGTSVTGVMSGLTTASANMRQAAEVMTESATAVQREAAETAGGAGQSSADLASVAAAVEQFTASVSEIARQVAVASGVADQAVRRAESSQTTIQGLATSTARIGDVVRLIDSIAGQTNLLALNATIEAARAGDAGKGFAVVAGEVKALAAQTAKATAEIASQIETVRTATEETVAAMNEIGGIIGRMGEVSTAISAAVEEQSVTTREIASSIQGVAGSTAQAAQAMENVVQVAERSGDASRNILGESAQIASEAEKLRREVEEFLRAVQTDSGERRRFERISGKGVTAMLRVAGSAPSKSVIVDISKTGISLAYAGPIAVGREAEIDLPDAGGPVGGRVIRADNGIIGIAFKEEPGVLARVDRALASLAGIRHAA